MSTAVAPGAMLRNGSAVDRDAVPRWDGERFESWLRAGLLAGRRMIAWFGRPGDRSGTVRLCAVLARDQENRLEAAETEVAQGLASLAPSHPQVQLFERELAEEWSWIPAGHPWLKSVRRLPGLAPAVPWEGFFSMAGGETHEVAVGPVHAGVIEPGHFRFQCLGEKVFHLEIALGYQHRGVERALRQGPEGRRLHYAETMAGDTTIGHATAYCQLVEAWSNTRVPVRAQALRAIALELERMANHAGDLGALANDVGYLPTASFCGRLRGDLLNLTALACGSRFGRGWVCPGGVAFDLEPTRANRLMDGLKKIMMDLRGACELLWNTPSVLARFENVGRLTRREAEALGLVGPAARASGLVRDARFDHPAGWYRSAQIPVSTWLTGDVFGRAYVRWLELQRSAAFILEQAGHLPAGAIRGVCLPWQPNRIAVALVEGWRGEIAHVGLTDHQGRLAAYKIVDPSFHNWFGLAMAMRHQEISDFPLCNKSFNLSYCGHDL